MKFIDPKTETLTRIRDDIVYDVEYYKAPVKLTGVTDESYPNYSENTTYSTGDYVIIPELKRIYRSASESNTKICPLTNPSDWVDYGAINSYRMLATDEGIGGKTTIVDGIMELNFNNCSAIAGVDLDFSSCYIMQIKTDGISYLSDYESGTSYSISDGVVYNNKLYVSNVDSNSNNTPNTSSEWTQRDDLVYFSEEILGADIGCSTYAEYFYKSFAKRTRKIITDLERLPTSILRFDFEGTATIGTIVYNNVEDMGCTLAGSTLKYQSSSKVSTNEITGFRTVLRYGKVRVLECDIIYNRELFGYTTQIIDKIVDKNIVWIPTEEDTFAEAISIGYIEDFTLPMDAATKTKSKARIIGVSK